MLKKIVIVLGIIVIILALLMIGFKLKANKMIRVIGSAKIENIDLSTIKDGTYQGSFKEFLVNVNLEVTVKDHTITDIRIIKQFAGKGYEAHDMLPKIIEAQSLQVDVVTGATGSSKGILLAVQNALLNK